MAAVRSARAVWNGELATGSGSVSATSSMKFTDLPVSWGSRTEGVDGRTSPEELIAAAHASCFCMALSAGLGRAGTPPGSLDVEASVTFDRVDGGFKIISSQLKVTGEVAGIDEATFKEAAEAAKDGCPVSKALAGNVDLSVVANLK
ncbi:MAG: OsmC family peroxiredoxin [Dehalococcoidia bacterium]